MVFKRVLYGGRWTERKKVIKLCDFIKKKKRRGLAMKMTWNVESDEKRKAFEPEDQRYLEDMVHNDKKKKKPSTSRWNTPNPKSISGKWSKSPHPKKYQTKKKKKVLFAEGGFCCFCFTENLSWFLFFLEGPPPKKQKNLRWTFRHRRNFFKLWIFLTNYIQISAGMTCKKKYLMYCTLVLYIVNLIWEVRFRYFSHHV